MEVPAEVQIYNQHLGKDKQGTLLNVHPSGFYEINLQLGERLHRVLLPIQSTVLIFRQPEEVATESNLEIER
jgi:hypothetical protein